MKKSVQNIFLIGILIAVLTGIENHANAHYFDTTKIDSAQISTTEDTLKNQPASLPHQSDPNALERKSQFDWKSNIGWMIAALAFIFGVYQYFRRRKDAKIKKLAELEATDEFNRQKQKKFSQSYEEMYRATLAEELGSIRLLGSPDIESIQVDLEDAFVSLNISETWRSEKRFDPRDIPKQLRDDRNLSPEEVMQRAFQNYRMLLIIGDPGSGKTTLLKYYTMCCLKNRYKQLGFKASRLPIFLPLRELDFKNGEPEGLPESLAQWAKKHVCYISESEFYNWLHHRKTLVLFDGLDEISDLKQRKDVCDWIDTTAAGLKNAYFVVTSRWTGYRKVDGIEIGFNHLRADVMDFTPEQQKEFLNKWFRAVYLRQTRDEKASREAWEKGQVERANERAQVIINFLNREENKSIQQLAAVPMLLQIMAIIWKDREFLAQSRAELYDAALNYLLEFRDRRRKLDPVLPADKARRVLPPTALWMQEVLQRDEVQKDKMHDFMQPILNTLDEQPKAEAFCRNLKNRAGLIADYGQTDYIFRHKSFREFMAGLQILKESIKSEERLEKLISHFTEDWWEESLRFFISRSDDQIFDQFFSLFFQSPVSQQLESNKQTLLLNLIKEAPQKKTDALVQWLNSDWLNPNQRRYVIDCLKTIGTKAAIQSIADADKKSWDDANLHYAKDIVAEILKPKITIAEEKRIKDLFKELPPSFRNPFEDHLEYILIPSGEFRYSVSKKMEPVPPIYFAKYPVTNKRYRRFIHFLAGKENELIKRLPLDLFAQKLSQFSKTIKGFDSDLKKDTKAWADQFRSGRDEDKKFGAEDQPVVGISWYAARTYCFWLSCLEFALRDQRKLNHLDQIPQLTYRYRLPTEIEWEWAAAGREPDGSLRKYPWKKEKGDPNPNLANYEQNVGATTPVSRYPEGATPEGLMDMAGNIWEWMENWYDKDEDFRALRGCSWGASDEILRCSARGHLRPDDGVNDVGFRVVHPQS